MPKSPIPAWFLCALGVFAPWPAVRAADEPFTDLRESVARVERETGGKVLQVRPIRRGDREIFRMKVLTADGRVKIVQDDPKRARDAARDALRRAADNPPKDD